MDSKRPGRADEAQKNRKDPFGSMWRRSVRQPSGGFRPAPPPFFHGPCSECCHQDIKWSPKSKAESCIGCGTRDTRVLTNVVLGDRSYGICQNCLFLICNANYKVTTVMSVKQVAGSPEQGRRGRREPLARGRAQP